MANQIRSQADADFNRLQQILDFEPATEGNPGQVRQQYIDQIQEAYDQAFRVLHPYIAYGASVSVNVQRMENDARAMIQSVKDQAESITAELTQTKDEALGILDDVRKVAAEQGVSQQAYHFRVESESHAKQSDRWLIKTGIAALLLMVYAAASFKLHTWLNIKLDSTQDAIVFAISKVLIFVVLSYVLFLSSRNFMSHKHNSVVNKHRQNALATFGELVNAAQDNSNKDVILTFASACIFSPQDTGYAKSGRRVASVRAFSR